MGILVEFRYKTKTGYSRKYKQCPDCYNVMWTKTLTQKVTIKEWAQWLYANCRSFWNEGSDFYKRIKFEKLFGRLKDLGISYEFWSCWREAKELSPTELRRIIEDYYKDEMTQSVLAPFEGIKK